MSPGLYETDPFEHFICQAFFSLVLQSDGCVRSGQDSLEEAGDVLATAERPLGQGGAVEQLWRHDEGALPDGFTVVTVAVVLNPKTVA